MVAAPGLYGRAHGARPSGVSGVRIGFLERLLVHLADDEAFARVGLLRVLGFGIEEDGEDVADEAEADLFLERLLDRGAIKAAVVRVPRVEAHVAEAGIADGLRDHRIDLPRSGPALDGAGHALHHLRGPRRGGAIGRRALQRGRGRVELADDLLGGHAQPVRGDDRPRRPLLALAQRLLVPLPLAAGDHLQIVGRVEEGLAHRVGRTLVQALGGFDDGEGIVRGALCRGFRRARLLRRLRARRQRLGVGLSALHPRGH